jgi:hypothetical protein
MARYEGDELSSYLFDEREHRVLSKATSAAGGYLVPQDFDALVTSARRARNVIGEVARVIGTDHGRVVPLPTATAHGTGAWPRTRPSPRAMRRSGAFASLANLTDTAGGLVFRVFTRPRRRVLAPRLRLSGASRRRRADARSVVVGDFSVGYAVPGMRGLVPSGTGAEAMRA